MFLGWLKKKIIGSKNDREIKRLRPVVDAVNALEKEWQGLTDAEIRAKTDSFKERLQQGETLEDIKVEAFAAVKSACRRLCGKRVMVCEHELEWNMIPFDVQIIGGTALHEGKIAEMATGEGKTLVAAFPLYLNALTGHNVQLVTVNEYLAQRDSEWMGQIYEFLGLTVGYITNAMRPDEKREIYNRDIVYGTASEFGFDYLRDNGMALDVSQQVQRDHYFCIIDEVDSILIDEARTPLIISGPVATSGQEKYTRLKPRVQQIVKEQNTHCAAILKEAEKLLEEDIKDERGAELLYMVGIGTPKNRRFIKLMEQPKYKRLYEKTNTQMHSDMRKHDNQLLKEELYFSIDEKSSQVNLSEKGRDSLSGIDDPEEFSVPDLIQFYQELDEDKVLDDEAKAAKREAFQHTYDEKMEKIHVVSQLLKAFSLFEKDVAYVVQENKVMIVDEFTGRLQPGRRFSDGLHQALEAKEGVKIEKETQTLATVTIQNYFRLYEKISGMTGTAETEADEFYQIYKMEVLVIPTNQPCVRDDQNDVIYKTKREKYKAIIDEVAEKYNEGCPVLVGTVTVDVSETISRYMKRRGIPHNVLNAKQNQKEAEIVAEAGKRGRVTIATNMAGRGTDIKLGQGVIEAGGLHIVGSERHESRRIDRQLRGRAGRQGDPGSSVFFISLEDDLMRLFGSDRIVTVMEKLGMEEDQDLQSPMLDRAMERAQKKVEERNFNIRKHTLDFDDVMNKQREVLYARRNKILRIESLKEFVLERLDQVVDIGLQELLSDMKGEIDFEVVESWYHKLWPMFPVPPGIRSKKNHEEIKNLMQAVLHQYYEQKEKYESAANFRKMERLVSLDVLDRLWKEHLRNMDDVREDAYLKAYGQRDPLQEYKRSAFNIFEELMARMDYEVATIIFRVTSISPESRSEPSQVDYQHETIDSYQSAADKAVTNQGGGQAAPKRPYVNPEKNVGRNDPCPCGSGRKYKKCCGR